MTEDAFGNAKAFVTTGAGCAQVTADQTDTSGKDEAADWRSVSQLGTVIGSEPCIRGHIPKLLNSLVGSAFGTLVQTNRLVDKDRFTVQVPSTQSFSAATRLAVAAGTVNGAAASGAGTFETSASQDSYAFTVPAGGLALSLNVASCPSQNSVPLLSWTLLSSSGAQVQGGSCGYSSLGTVAGRPGAEPG